MASKKAKQTRTDAKAAEAPARDEKAQGGGFLVFRETIESIVVAFVLAFLFRTFEAEAFVIPTGSMSPSLQGQHKDVECTECGYSFRVTASSEGEARDKMIAQLRAVPSHLKQVNRALDAEEAAGRGRSQRAQYLRGQRNYLLDSQQDLPNAIANVEVVGGMCPMCRQLMPMRSDLPENVRDVIDVDEVEEQPSYPGDRILVNKYGFDFSEPERWDTIVFKFPGDGNMNYIKRLTGLPGETVRVYQGDLFTKPLDAPASEFEIERKPPDKVEAMLHEVHNTDYEAAALHRIGFPLRWDATTPDGWNVEAEPNDRTVEQLFTVDSPAEGGTAWLRYRHVLPGDEEWQLARDVEEAGSVEAVEQAEGVDMDELKQYVYPRLINDFNAYNARLTRQHAIQDGWRINPNKFGPDAGSLGTEWVGDLAMEADVEVGEARGELVLDLVEAGYHFQAAIDLTSGTATLSIVDGRTGERVEGFEATRQTGITGAGEYSLRFANVDDRLLLWVDGELVAEGAVAYNPDELFDGGRAGMVPWASANPAEDQGDLAPAGVGARGAKLTVTRLSVLRDIYYIATKYPQDQGRSFVIDYDYTQLTFDQLLSRPEHFEHFGTRHARDFDVEEGQLLVLGDNSPESKDCRLWMMGDSHSGIPGGPYLDRELLIGKAVAVFWPHSWGGIPGLKKLPGWPNFRDMRLVR
ncbi:MAG TPA: S26 family signal peptidase [Lacipirellula sp.]